MNETQHDIVRREFGQQAARFGEQGLTLSNEAYLQWMVEQLDLQPHFEVLDVAAGTGHLSRAMAPHVKRVVALDLTPEMLAQGQREAEQQGLTNVVFEPGEAEHLPMRTRPLTWWSRVFRYITSPMRVVRSRRWCACAAAVGEWP